MGVPGEGRDAGGDVRHPRVHPRGVRGRDDAGWRAVQAPPGARAGQRVLEQRERSERRRQAVQGAAEQDPLPVVLDVSAVNQPQFSTGPASTRASFLFTGELICSYAMIRATT